MNPMLEMEKYGDGSTRSWVPLILGGFYRSYSTTIYRDERMHMVAGSISMVSNTSNRLGGRLCIWG